MNAARTTRNPAIDAGKTHLALALTLCCAAGWAGCYHDTVVDPTPPGSGETAPPDVAAMLEAIPGLTWVEEASSNPDYGLYYLEFTQPVDHGAPEGPWFEQRLVLLHRSFDAPMVLHTTGYFAPEGDRLSEPAAILGANQLSVEHRFFVPSRPDVSSWDALTIAQSADDFHRVVEAFQPYYSGRWIGTGASKGGMTSVYHRRFHPDDLYATVAYVAPLSFGPNDTRYIDFLEQVGPADCRDRLAEFQRTALLDREALVDYVVDLAATWGLTYDILGIDMAVEHAVLELPFAFWQYYGEWLCSSIPSSDAPPTDVAAFVDYVSWFSFYSDEDILDYEPYYYQAATQLGYPAISENAVADLLHYPGTDVAETYVTFEIDEDFDTQAMVDIDTWSQTEGQRLMYIYGENDPWTAGAFQVGTAEDTHLFIVPGGNHGSTIMDLSASDRADALSILERWAGVESPASMQDLERPPLPRPARTYHRPLP